MRKRLALTPSSDKTRPEYPIPTLQARFDLSQKWRGNALDVVVGLADEHQRQIEFFVRTSLPPVEGIFYDGQIFDAYVFVSDLIRSARNRIILIDNYIDESVLVLLSKREASVSAEIRTGHITRQLKLDVQKHNSQYPPVIIVRTHNVHDRFLITDDDVYHLGASLKDLGKKLFAFSKLCLSPAMLL